MNTNNTKIYQYLGAIHIHSKFSDGTGNIDVITKAAKNANLDWIVITDHNNMDIPEGMINGVCVIKGEEISQPADNHYLAIDIDKTIQPDSEQNYVEAVRELGGFGFAAHPDESLTRKNNSAPIRWTNKEIIPDGIEIWNWFSQWADHYDSTSLFKIIYSFIFRHQLISKPYRETLEWWDNLNKKSKTFLPVIGGVDAHALKISKYIIPVTVFPYETQFKTITNVLQLKEPLSENFTDKKRQILNAIKAGNNIIINRRINKNLPEIVLVNPQETYCCGESIPLGKSTYLRIKIPIKAFVKIYKDGNEKYSEYTNNLIYSISEYGKYRIEIEIETKGYIYTNVFVVI